MQSFSILVRVVMGWSSNTAALGVELRIFGGSLPERAGGAGPVLLGMVPRETWIYRLCSDYSGITVQQRTFQAWSSNSMPPLQMYVVPLKMQEMLASPEMRKIIQAWEEGARPYIPRPIAPLQKQTELGVALWGRNMGKTAAMNSILGRRDGT